MINGRICWLYRALLQPSVGDLLRLLAVGRHDGRFCNGALHRHWRMLHGCQWDWSVPRAFLPWSSTSPWSSTRPWINLLITPASIASLLSIESLLGFLIVCYHMLHNTTSSVAVSDVPHADHNLFPGFRCWSWGSDTPQELHVSVYGTPSESDLQNGLVNLSADHPSAVSSSKILYSFTLCFGAITLCQTCRLSRFSITCSALLRCTGPVKSSILDYWCR